MTFYTLTEEDFEAFGDILPAEVARCFGRPGYFMLGAVTDDHALAAALQFYLGMPERDEYRARVTYLMVDEESAEEEIGSLLLEELRRVLKKSGVRELQLKTDDLAILAPEKESELRVIGQEKTPVYETTIQALTETEAWQRPAPDYVRSLSELTNREFKGLLSEITTHTGTTPLPSDLPLSITEYHGELSSWYRKEDGAAFFLVREDADGMLHTVLLRAYGKDFEKGILALFNRSAEAALEEFEPETPVRIICYSDGVYRLMKKLYPTLSSDTIIEGIIEL